MGPETEGPETEGPETEDPETEGPETEGPETGGKRCTRANERLQSGETAEVWSVTLDSQFHEGLPT